MSTIERVVIVGGGMAGGSAAFALRDEGFQGEITLIGDEQEWPYERPPLSKGYLRSEEPIEKAHVRPPADYESNAINLLRGTTVNAIDPASRSVLTSSGKHRYDELVLATGAQPRRLDIPGGELEGIRYLRTRSDADELRDGAEQAEHIVVVGGGWIGAEVAASLRLLGRGVTVLIAGGQPLEHVLGAQIGAVYREAHEERGVRFVTGRMTRAGGHERVEWIETTDGLRLPADLVVVGIGASPRASLAMAAGLRIHRGAIEVDEYLRTSAPSIYAIGDAAAAWNLRYQRWMRSEHWDNAKRQARAVAANIVGRGTAYDRVPYFYSDQYDVGMEYRGFAPEWDELVVRGDLDEREFHAFWLRDGRVCAAMNVNQWDDGDALEALVERGERVDTGRLADPEVPLSEVTAQTAPA